MAEEQTALNSEYVTMCESNHQHSNYNQTKCVNLEDMN